jgi:hypothetical protein
MDKCNVNLKVPLRMIQIGGSGRKSQRKRNDSQARSMGKNN